MGGDIFFQRMSSTHHLLHTVPVDQSVWISEVSLVVLVISHHKLATEAQKKMHQSLVFNLCLSYFILKLRISLCLQKKLLVEGLVLVAPFVSAAPAGMAAISDATVTSTGFKGEVQ